MQDINIYRLKKCYPIPTKLLEAEDCMKSARVRSFSGPFSVQMRESTDQKNPEYGHLLRKGRRKRLFGPVLTYGKYPNRMVVTVKFRVIFAPHLDTNVYDLI